MDNNRELVHWGVKGMKWGVRRARKPQYQQISRDQLGRMSTKEIKDMNDRMRAEQQYYELTKKPKNPVTKFASDVALQVGKNLAADYLSKYAKVVLNEKVPAISKLNEKSKKLG